MEQSKFIIHISGPSCSGKSTIGSLLAEKFPGMYTISYDKLKWLLSGYDRDRHRGLIKDIEIGLLEVVCRQSIPIELNFFFQDEEAYLKIKSMVEKYNYSLISVELTAPIEILLGRFRDRVRESKQKGIKLSVVSEEVFLENVSRRSYVSQGTPVFDTSSLNAQEIVGEIRKLLPLSV